ncbi:MAG: DUF1801 domain-containing protein [Ferruginibacter sp.]
MAATVPKIRSILELYELLTNEERLIVDILRELIREQLPSYCKEKISYNVPFFYGRKGICIIWPASIPRGGIKEGVLLGYWYGNRLTDPGSYLTHGSNKQIYYKLYNQAEEIDAAALSSLLREAVALDRSW